MKFTPFWKLVFNSALAELQFTYLSDKCHCIESILPSKKGSSFKVSFVGLHKIKSRAALDNDHEEYIEIAGMLIAVGSAISFVVVLY